MATNAAAWETETPRENTPQDWQSLYASFPVKTDTNLAWNNNEHARLAHMALKKLGLAKLYSIGGPSLTAIDLNASLFRRALKKRGVYIKNAPASPLEERLLPPPVHFAGLPDISYTMYDWINKNAFCPPGIPSRNGKPADKCHAFKGWMGALNSSHFGTQAGLWYRHLHAVALDLAGRAREMREKMQKHGPETVAAYKDYLKEAEYEALAFEGYAQHFLQDRWSMGHMWERWNAADYDQLVFKTYYDNFETAIASGLMHGSQSITGAPDPLSSPYLNPLKGRGLGWVRKLFGKSAYIIPTWRHAGAKGMDPTRAEILQRDGGLSLDTTPHTGVGDNRVEDMLDHLYGKEFSYPDKPLEVGIQKQNLLRCTMGGWVDVIKGFGLDRESGGYGVNGVTLPTGARGLSEDVNLTIGCFDNWATNRSMALAWTDLYATFGSFARIAIGFVEDKTTALLGKRFLKNNRISGVKVTWRVWRHAMTNPDGTDLARGAIGSYGQVKQGGKYRALPSYIEPKNLEDLPEGPGRNGRDKEAVFGFFNRAHTDWWCNEGLADLDGWRGSDDKAEQAACRLVADRYYAGTDRAYQGIRKETRTVDGSATGKRLVPVCSMYNREVPDAGYSERLPVTLAPGYVAEPYKRSADNFSTQSIANWCGKIPVLDLLPQPENRDEDLVALVREQKDNILLEGQNLGDKPGRLILGDAIIIKKSDILEWDRMHILFRLDKNRKFEEKDYPVKITRSDKVSSVGRFFIRIKKKPPKPEPPALDISGCWKGTTTFGTGFISLFQSGHEVIATVPLEEAYMKPGTERVEVVYSGTFDPPHLTLSHRAKDFTAIDPLLWRYRVDTYPQKQRDALLAFGLESKFELRVVKGPSPLFLLLQGSPNAEFHLEGKYYSFTSTFAGWNEVINGYPYENKVTRDEEGIETVTINDHPVDAAKVIAGFKKDCPAPNFLLYDVDKTREVAKYLCWRPLTGKRAKPDEVTWEKVSDMKVGSLAINDAGFTKPLDKLQMGDQIWIRAKARSGCPDIRDHLEATIFPEDRPKAAIHVMLTETGPETSEFRSLQAVATDDLEIGPTRTIIIRAGLKGASIRVTVDKAPVSQPSRRPAGGGLSASKQGKGKITGGAAHKTPAGGQRGGGQIVIPAPVGAGRKPVTPPLPQRVAKAAQWTVYKLTSYADPHGGLPKMTVVKIAFKRSAKLAQLRVRRYPVSLSRNDQTGKILWSVNWDSGEIGDQGMASNPAAMDMLQHRAQGMRRGAVAKSGLEALIGQQLGAGSQRKSPVR